MTTPDDPTTRAAAYAAGAMDAEERAAFERELASDPRLAAETRGFVETAVQLGLSVDPEAPAPALRGSVLDAIVGVPQHTAAAPAQADAAPVAAVTPIRRWYRRPLAAVAAAAVVVGIAGGATAYVLGTTGSTQAPTASEEILAAPDARSSTARVAGGGTATLVWSVSLDRSAIVASDLPEIASDQVYELWYIDADGPRSAGTFAAASADVELQGALGTGSSVGVTVEPTGGSPQPTTDPIVVIAAT